jgi:type II secretory pathway component PulM
MNLPLGATLHSLRERVTQSLRVYISETVGVSNVLTRLSSRERLSLGAATLALGVIVGYVFVIDPLWEMHLRLRARIATKEQEVREVVKLGRTYETLRHEVDGLRPSQSGSPQSAALSPFAVLEGLATSTFGRDKLAAINPTGHETYEGVNQETIELKLSGVSLQDFVALLYKMDTAGSTLRCTNLTVKKRYKDPYTFDVTLTAIALTPR